MKEKLLNRGTSTVMAGAFSIVAFCFFLIACHPIVKTLGPFASHNVAESKEIGAFLWEYYPVDIMINDTLNFSIKEAFAEKQYGYKSYNDITYEILPETQINIVLSNPILLNAFGLWSVENFDIGGEYILVSNYNERNPPDSVLVKILKEDYADDGTAGKDDGKVLNYFTLRRKK